MVGRRSDGGGEGISGEQFRVLTSVGLWSGFIVFAS